MECAVCMMEMLEEDDDLMLLPCNGHKACCTDNSATCCGHATVGRPHAFHASCLQRWLLKSSACPTCRSDLRRQLPSSLGGDSLAARPSGSPFRGGGVGVVKRRPSENKPAAVKSPAWR